MHSLGMRIKELRKVRGISQEVLVTQLQLRGHTTMTQQRQSMVELGQRDISAGELVSYARILGIPITELLGVPDHAPE